MLLLLLAYMCNVFLSRLFPLAVFKVAVPVLLSLAVIRLGVKVLQAAFKNAPWVRALERSISWLAWLAMLLWVSGLLPVILEELDDIKWKMGTSTLSLRNMLEGALTAGVVILITLWISSAIESRLLRTATGSELSLRKAVSNATRVTLVFVGLLLALSANSPFWEGRRTGLQSNRSKIMEGLPTAGLPYQMRNWSEYVWLVKHLRETGFINSIREIWWDIRPHHDFGTVELRVCDVPPCLDHVLAITALVQCLVHTISNEIDEGTFLSEYHPMMVEQNKWRATRYGADAALVSSTTFQQRSVPELVEELTARLTPTAIELNCLAELTSVLTLPAASGARRQVEIYEATGSRRKVVEKLLERPAY